MRAILLWLAAGLALAVRSEAGVSRLELDQPRSVVEVQVHSTFDTFVVRLEQFRAEIAIDPAARSVEHVELSFLMADLRTGRPQRDRHMLAWEEAERYPSVAFRLSGRVGPAAGPSPVRGVVTLHGVEHEVAFNVTFLMQDAVGSIDGEAEIDYRDHGLPLIRKFWVLRVDPVLRVRFHLQGRVGAAPARLAGKGE